MRGDPGGLRAGLCCFRPVHSSSRAGIHQSAKQLQCRRWVILASCAMHRLGCRQHSAHHTLTDDLNSPSKLSGIESRCARGLALAAGAHARSSSDTASTPVHSSSRAGIHQSAKQLQCRRWVILSSCAMHHSGCRHHSPHLDRRSELPFKVEWHRKVVWAEHCSCGRSTRAQL